MKKKGNKKMPTPRHNDIHNPIPTSLCFISECLANRLPTLPLPLIHTQEGKTRAWFLAIRSLIMYSNVWLSIVCSVYLFVSGVQEQHQGAYALLLLQGATGVCSGGQPQHWNCKEGVFLEHIVYIGE